jgi:hypothetical protein
MAAIPTCSDQKALQVFTFFLRPEGDASDGT